MSEVPSTTSLQELDKRLTDLQKEVERQRKKTASSATVTLVVGLILLIFIAGYFTFGYTMFKSVLDPEQLVAATTDMIENQLPEYRKTIEGEIKNNAPTWAEQASEQGLAALPQLRERIENAAIDQANNMIENFAVMSEDEFRRVLRENKDILQDSFKQLASEEELSEDMLKLVEDALEKQLQGSMEENASTILRQLRNINMALEDLADDNELTQDERKMREVLMIARRLQLEQADPNFKGKKVPRVSKKTAKKVVEKPAAPAADTAAAKKAADDAAKKKAAEEAAKKAAEEAAKKKAAEEAAMKKAAEDAAKKKAAEEAAKKAAEEAAKKKAAEEAAMKKAAEDAAKKKAAEEAAKKAAEEAAKKPAAPAEKKPAAPAEKK